MTQKQISELHLHGLSVHFTAKERLTDTSKMDLTISYDPDYGYKSEPQLVLKDSDDHEDIQGVVVPLFQNAYFRTDKEALTDFLNEIVGSYAHLESLESDLNMEIRTTYIEELSNKLDLLRTRPNLRVILFAERTSNNLDITTSLAIEVLDEETEESKGFSVFSESSLTFILE